MIVLQQFCPSVRVGECVLVRQAVEKTVFFVFWFSEKIFFVKSSIFVIKFVKKVGKLNTDTIDLIQNVGRVGRDFGYQVIT